MAEPASTRRPITATSRNAPMMRVRGPGSDRVNSQVPATVSGRAPGRNQVTTRKSISRQYTTTRLDVAASRAMVTMGMPW